MPASLTFTVRNSPHAPPVETPLGIPIVVRSPRSATSVTVAIDAAFEEYLERPPQAEPGIEVSQVLVLTENEDTITALIEVGPANARFFTWQGTEYKLTLLTVGSEVQDGQAFATYEFFLETVAPDGPDTVARRRKACQELIKAYEGNPTPTLDQELAYATDLFERASRDMAPDLEGARMIAWALRFKAHALVELGRYAEAIEATTMLVNEFDKVPDNVVAEQVAAGVLYRGNAWDKLGEPHKALHEWGMLMQNLGNSPHPSARRLTAAALLNSAVVRHHRGLPEVRELLQRVVTDFQPLAAEDAVLATRVQHAQQLLAQLPSPP